MQAQLADPGYGWLRRGYGKALYWRYRLLQQRKHAEIVLQRINGSPYVILPGVLNPQLMRTGAYFASQLGSELIRASDVVLDMGTGSGICAVAAARHARQVVAVDLNREAVRCARINVLLHRVDSRVEVLLGDLFAPVAGRRFDVILFNPPFLRRAPRDEADRAWASTDVAERFAAGLRAHLAPGGSAFVLLSSYGSAASFLEQFRQQGLALSVIAERSYVNERLAIFQVSN